MVGTMPAKTYRRNALARAEEALMRVLVSLGIVPHTYLLEVRGARSGRLRTVPVTVVENGGRWLVAPYGERAWVRNVRASGADLLEADAAQPTSASRRSARRRRHRCCSGTGG